MMQKASGCFAYMCVCEIVTHFKIFYRPIQNQNSEGLLYDYPLILPVHFPLRPEQ